MEEGSIFILVAYVFLMVSSKLMKRSEDHEGLVTEERYEALGMPDNRRKPGVSFAGNSSCNRRSKKLSEE